MSNGISPGFHCLVSPIFRYDGAGFLRRNLACFRFRRDGHPDEIDQKFFSLRPSRWTGGVVVRAPASLLSSGGQTPYQLVVLGDPHLPGKFLTEKEAVLRTINAWPDVTLVVAVGDICEDLGTEKEYSAARQFFNKLAKPFVAIPGNHDFIY